MGGVIDEALWWGSFLLWNVGLGLAVTTPHGLLEPNTLS